MKGLTLGDRDGRARWRDRHAESWTRSRLEVLLMTYIVPFFVIKHRHNELAPGMAGRQDVAAFRRKGIGELHKLKVLLECLETTARQHPGAARAVGGSGISETGAATGQDLQQTFITYVCVSMESQAADTPESAMAAVSCGSSPLEPSSLAGA
jgi:hypothetical protein